MRQFFRNNGLTIAAMGLFVVSWVGQLIAGFYAHNEELESHGAAPLASWLDYLSSGHFLEATFENWESEFLQMAIFVVLSAYLYQRGSAESNPLPEEDQEGSHYPMRYFKSQPILRKLYENSLSIVLFALFLVSFIGHLYGGWREENTERALTGAPSTTMSEFMISADFWFQSFQNWQSEFLSIAAITYLTIYLRQKDSAQSKPIDAPHSKTEEGAG